MDRLYKYLQITALVVALLAPWIYFVGYAYDWGYLDSFAIEHQMFFKAPQEYLGIAYVVFIEVLAKLISAIPDGLVAIVFLAIAILAVVFFALKYWGHRYKLWPRFYHRFSNWLLRRRGIITSRFFTSVAAPAYLVSSLPVLVMAGFLYLFILVITPGLIGYSQGQEAAKKLKKDWRAETCSPKNMMLGCTQILVSGKVIASGKLVVASEKNIAIFDGSSVQIYSLRNRDIKTVLTK